MDGRIVVHIEFNINYGWNDETASEWLVKRCFRPRYYSKRHPDYSGRFINYFQTPRVRVKSLKKLQLPNGIAIYFGVKKERCVKSDEN